MNQAASHSRTELGIKGKSVLSVAAGPQLHVKAIPSLDGWRAISILVVFLGHIGFGHVIPGGLGVTIFFFLSGYLITSLMLAEVQKTGRLNIRHFYYRRFLRLMPTLFLTLAIVYLLVGVGLLGGRATLKGLAAQVFYFSNYYTLFFDPGETLPNGTAILWSLAVEEHFYIAYPLLFSILGARCSRKQLAAVFVLVCIGVLGWRLHLVGQPGFSAERTYYATDTRLDSILWGCVFALAWNPLASAQVVAKMRFRDYALVALAFAAQLFALLVRNPAFRESARYSIQGVALMPLFYYSITNSRHLLFRYLNAATLQWIGKASYSIYLIHYVAISFIERNWPILKSPLFLGPLVIVISAAYSYAVDSVVEPYFRRLRSRFR